VKLKYSEPLGVYVVNKLVLPKLYGQHSSLIKLIDA
jgi:hypothetical protein